MIKVIKFSAPWCGPCKAYAPIWKATTAANKISNVEFTEIDCDEDEGAVVKYKIASIPTTIILKDDREVIRMYGVVTQLSKLVAKVAA